MSIEYEQPPIHIKQGDCLISRNAFPPADIIIHPSSKNFFKLNVFRNLLEFLELVVLYERVIELEFKTVTEQDEEILGHEEIEEAFRIRRVIPVPNIGLEERIETLLRPGETFIECICDYPEYNPQTYVTRLLPDIPYLQKELESHLEYGKFWFQSRNKAKHLALISLARDVGNVLCLSKFAKDNNIPYYITRGEKESFIQIDSLEQKARAGVISFLKENLDKSVSIEISRLAEIGRSMIYPKTPISWQIIKDSHSPRDLITITLQLREHYKMFRKNMLLMEAEIFSDDVTLKRKLSLLREIKQFAAEMWPDQGDGFQKTIKDTTGFIDLIIDDAAQLSISRGAYLLTYLLAQPTDFLIKQLRRRKIRVLLKARKDFMASKKWAEKIASIFSIPTDIVKEQIRKEDLVFEEQ